MKMNPHHPYNDSQPALSDSKLDTMISNALSHKQLERHWWKKLLLSTQDIFALHPSLRLGAGFATVAVCLLLTVFITHETRTEYSFTNDFAEIMYFETLEQLS